MGVDNLRPGPGTGAFVGREREMAELRAALDDAFAGRGRLVMLAGEPGIGKTRIAQELASRARTLGAQVLWGWCYEQEGAPPYWPWAEPIRDYVQHCGSQQLESEMGPGAADIAEIVPEVRQKLPDLMPAPTLEPEQARFRLFDSTTKFLKNAAHRQPLLLVLDDLHWADKHSLLMLEFLARQMAESRILIVGAYRDIEISRQHPLSESLAQLSRQPVFRRAQVRGLSQEETGRFLRRSAGHVGAEEMPPQGLVEAIYARTEGNPFFVIEVARLLAEQQELAGESAAGSFELRIPEGVREVIGQRLNRLSDECNHALTTASVIGREFTLDLLGQLIQDLSPNRLLETLEEALAARVIEELPHPAGRYQFSHALIRETLLGELSLSRRVRVHALIGEALEVLYGDDVEHHAAELAQHFTQAQTVLGTEKLVRYSLLAGERALASYAWEAALSLFQGALSATEGQPANSGTAALFFGLGRAQTATLPRNQLGQAVASLDRALDYYAKEGDIDSAVIVAEFPFNTAAGTFTGAAELIGRALALVSADSHEAGRLLCRYGEALAIDEGNYNGAQEAFGRALFIARRDENTSMEMWTLAYFAQAELYQLRFREGSEKGSRAIELARQVNDPRAEVIALYWTLLSLRNLGEIAEARRYASSMLTSAEKLRDRRWLVNALDCNQHLSLIGGQWEDARTIGDRVLEIAPQEPRSLSRRMVAEFQTGYYGQGKVFLDRLVTAMRSTVPGPSLEHAHVALLLPAVAQIAGLVDDGFAIAQEAAAAVLSDPRARPLYAMYARNGLALMAVQRSDAVAAATQYAFLEPLRGTLLAVGPVNDRLLGLLAQTMGNVDQAMIHFEDALAFCRKAGYRPELAWSCCDYAGLLLDPSTSSG